MVVVACDLAENYSNRILAEFNQFSREITMGKDRFVSLVLEFEETSRIRTNKQNSSHG